MQLISQKGFTLIEISIAIIIVTIMISVITVGSSLAKQARLRSIITEVNDFRTAMDLFEGKYKALPGDITNAYDYWGSKCDVTASNCNGNGDGRITFTNGLALDNESYRAWQHLSLAGMIKGSYTGVAQAATPSQSDIGINIPESNFNHGGWIIWYDGNYSPPLTSGNYFELGAARAGYVPDNPLMTPTEAYNIDKKIDDGYPRNGLIFGTQKFNTNCYAGGDTLSASYSLGNSDNIWCGLKAVFRK